MKAKDWLKYVDAVRDSRADAQLHKANNELWLNGKCTDHIWCMEDGDEPHIIGVRMDCGDSGTVYLTRSQAKDLSEQLAYFVTEAK